MEPLILLEGVCHQYPHQDGPVPVLNRLNLEVEQGEYLAIMGSSGSGKSTLLHILGCLLRATSGRYLLDGLNVFQLGEEDLAGLRSTMVSHVFQNFHLLPAMTVLENVRLPFLYRVHGDRESETLARQALHQVGLSHRLHHVPSQLSGGEMQRAAIARALAVQPRLILADEPTGNLDRATTLEILDVFRQIHQQGRTIVVVTHDFEVAAQATRILHLHRGCLA